MAGRTVRFRLAFAGRFVRITYTLVPWTRLARAGIVGPMKTLITIAAVAILGIYAFSWLLAAPVTVLVIGAAIWVISL